MDRTRRGVRLLSASLTRGRVLRTDVQPAMAAISGPYRPSNTSANMRVRLLGNSETPAFMAARNTILGLGHCICGTDDPCDIAVAPLLTEKVPEEKLMEPTLGTLIFHPSPLPYGRGAASIKWAYRRSEPITAATWFWADKGLDTGDICEQEIVKIDYALRPRDFYQQHIIPAMLRTLERCLIGIQSGVVRRVPQVEEYSSFDFIEKK